MGNDTPWEYCFAVPFPPSVNTYWRHTSVQGRVQVLISKKGRHYRSALHHAWNQVKPHGFTTLMPPARFQVDITLYPPDRRIRDVDNYSKAILDGLSRCAFWSDDSQCDILTLRRGILGDQDPCPMIKIKEL